MEEVDLWDLVVELEAADIGTVERERERVREYNKGVKRREEKSHMPAKEMQLGTVMKAGRQAAAANY